MSRKSIDGLVMRDVPKRRQANARAVESLPRRRVGVVSKERLISSPARPVVQRRAQRIEQPEASIEDFLDEPTTLNLIDDEKPRPKRRNIEVREQERGKKRRKKPKKPRSKKKIVLRIFLVFLLLVGIGVGVLFYIGNDFFAKVTGGGSLWNFITANADTPLQEDPTTKRTNVLIFGTEGYSMDNPNYDGGWLTDSMMMASIDQKNGDIKLISLPRDLKTRTCTAAGKLNEIYQCVYTKNDGSEASRRQHEIDGAKALEKKFEEILGQKIQYFVHINWGGLVQIIDAIGGIDVKIIYQGEKWHGKEVAIETTDKRGLAEYDGKCNCYRPSYKHGEIVHLDGEAALYVARMRNHSGGYGASGGNFSREQFQQKIIQAAVLKAQEKNYLQDFGAILKIKDAVGDNLRMNFKDTELKTATKLLSKLKLSEMKSIPLQRPDGEEGSLFTTGMLPVPGVNGLSCGGSVPGCLSYVYPRAGINDYSAIIKYVSKKLVSSPASNEKAQIVVMNGTETPGLAAKKAKKLEKKGLNVIDVKNAPEALSGKKTTRIYQRNSDMPQTAKLLKELLGGAKLSQKLPKSLQSTKADFIVVLGE